jgi:putative membrane protein
MRVAATAIASLVWVASLSAHGGEAHETAWLSDRPGALSPWDLAVIALLLAIAGLYFTGARRIARRGAVRLRRETIAFWCGWSALMAAVSPPLDALSIQLFSAHMAQHELMMLVGAPLLIAGRPLSTCLWGVPQRWRARVAAPLQASFVSGTWRWLTAPVVAWALHGIALWVWHVPALYDAAVEHEGIHALQHAMFVGTSALFWWGLIYGRYGRVGYGAAVFYVFTTVVHTGILGAAMTFSGIPLYPVYATPAAARGVDILEDQQLAGLIMWIPAGIVLTLFGLGLFAAWLGEAERRNRDATTMS